MHERQRLIRAIYFKTREEEREMFCNISSDEVAEAMDRYSNQVFCNGPADTFLRKIQAVTGSISHCAGAAKTARQRMFAMTASFGLPCVLLTITPEDAVNFRIRIMAKGKEGSETPPCLGSDEEIRCKFVMECEKIRVENPGLCAIDFENVIDIVVEHILGWDRKKRCNKPGYGFLGDLEAWCFTVEAGKKNSSCTLLTVG